MAMTDAQLRAKIRELMAAGVLPSAPAPIQRPVPPAPTGPKPHILDCDHRLVSEGLQQLDLAIGESARHGTAYRDDANGGALSKHWNDQDTSPADCPGQRPRLCWIVPLWIGFDIGYMDDRTLKDRPPDDEGPGGRCRIEPV